MANTALQRSMTEISGSNEAALRPFTLIPLRFINYVFLKLIHKDNVFNELKPFLYLYFKKDAAR